MFNFLSSSPSPKKARVFAYQAPRKALPPRPIGSAEVARNEAKINKLLSTEAGLERIAAVLSGWAREGKERKFADARAASRANINTPRGRPQLAVDGDDLVHPITGRYVGAAKWMREHPNAHEPMLS